MKSRIFASAAVLGLLAALCAGEAFAAGKGNRGAGKGQAGSGTCSSSTGTTVRPAGSQRRDGTFLTTGVTANGGATRPANGNGLQDGSRLNPAAPVAPVPAP